MLVRELLHEGSRRHTGVGGGERAQHVEVSRRTRIERGSSGDSMSALTEGGPKASQRFVETSTCWGRGEGAACRNSTGVERGSSRHSMSAPTAGAP